MITLVRSGPQALVFVVLAAAAGAGVLLRERFLAKRTEGAPTAGSSAVRGVATSETSEASPLPLASASGAPTSSASSGVEPPAAATLPSATSSCPAGMALVSGSFCTAVAHFCAEWIGDDPTAAFVGRPVKRCRRYKPQLVCEGDPIRLHFCMDRHEYPNLPGVPPVLMASYRDAVRACAVEGKRVCESDEWMLACEGPSTSPYPTGLEREPRHCSIDRPRRLANPDALSRPADVSLEIGRLDQRTPSGANPRCASAFGIEDLVGNVVEWVHHRKGQRGGEVTDTALAGGGWEPAPSTCRDLDTRRGPDHASPQTGFRCCADALDGEPARKKGTGSTGRRRTAT